MSESKPFGWYLMVRECRGTDEEPTYEAILDTGHEVLMLWSGLGFDAALARVVEFQKANEINDDVAVSCIDIVELMMGTE